MLGCRARRARERCGGVTSLVGAPAPCLESRDVCPRAGIWEGDVPRKEISLGRTCGPREGDVPRKMLPGSRCLWEGDVPGKETSLGSCHLQGGVPGKKMSPGRRHLWEGDVPPFRQPKARETLIPPCPAHIWGCMNGPQPREPAVVTVTGTHPPLESEVAAREGAGDTEPAESSVCHHPALINAVLSSP